MSRTLFAIGIILLQEGLSEVLENSQIDDPFLQLFWEEQKKAANRDPRGMRWHPMMIRQVNYCKQKIQCLRMAI